MDLGAPILAIAFAAPWLFAGGAAATSVPIIIHLLNKRRFKIRFWAAMEFLLAAQRKNARRMEFQRWLLLILRCLALIILAAGVAKLVMDNFWTPLKSDRIIVILLDDSYSMGYTDPTAAAKDGHFQQAKKLLVDWLGTLKAGDRVAILRTSRGAPPLLANPTTDRDVVRQLLNGLTVSDGGTDLASAMDKATKIMQDARQIGSAGEVVLVTDLSYSSIAFGRPESGQVKEKLQKASEALHKVAAFRVVDVGTDDQANKGITTLRTKRPLVVTDSDTRLEIGVTNGTRLEQNNVKVTLSVDGTPVKTETFPKMEPGEESLREVAVRLKTMGRHVIEAQLEPDFVTADDTRRIIVDAEERAPLLVVDGDPGDIKFDTTLMGLAFGLDPKGKPTEEFAPRVITEMDLEQTNLDTFDGVVLSDIASINEKTAGALKKYVQEGGVLMIFPGPHITPDAIARALGEGGVGLLPAKVVQLVRMDNEAGVTIASNFHHPFLEVFLAAAAKQEKTGMEKIRTTQYFKVALPTDGTSEVVLYYQDGEKQGDPAVVTRRDGKGRVVLFTSTAGPGWSSLASWPGYKELLQEVMFHAISRGSERYTLGLNESINLPRDVAEPHSWEGPRNTKIDVRAVVDPKDNTSRLTSPPLTLAGVYGPPGAAKIIAVNVDSDEADIRHLTEAQARDALKVDRGDMIINPTKLDASLVKSGQEGDTALPHWLLLGALLLFALETLFARLFSVYR